MMTDRFLFDPRPLSGPLHALQPPRLTTLDGAVLALVDNGKQHAGELLALVVEELGRCWSIAGVVQVGPPSPGHGGNVEDVRTAATWATAAVAGVGDCGSCSVGTMTDLVLFERIGLPATAIFTRPFATVAHAIAENNGMNARIALIDHPIAGVDRQELLDRARLAATEVATALLEGDRR
jgi:hypothetical protein